MSLVDQIVKQAELVRSADAALKTAINRYQQVKALNGQQGYSINIGGLTVQVAEMGPHYGPQMIRGCEMIHLGALKVLDGDIDRCRKNLNGLRLELAALGERMAVAARGAA